MFFQTFQQQDTVMSTTSQHRASNAIGNDIAQQSRTFLRWINSNLKKSNRSPVSDVQHDLNDGMVLVELLETLSGKKIGNKFTKINSKLRQHHLDRINLVLEFMHTENIETFTKIGELNCFQ